jgi:hypothetical protein
MEEKDVRAVILARQKDNKIPCRTALQIAEETGVSPHKVGELLNELEIKIHSCQLGCFK